MSTYTAPPTTIVGTYTLTEPRSHRYDISETASRYEQVELAAGTYEVHATRGYTNSSEVRLHAQIPGVVTSRYDGAEYFGVGIGNSPQHGNHPDVGKERDVRVPLLPDAVTFNEVAHAELAWSWLTGLWPRNGRVECHSHRSLTWTDALHRPTHRLVADDGLPEYLDDPHALMLRINELLDAGIKPDVTHRYGTDEPVTESQWFPEHSCSRL